jgi:hypothetical protein
VTLPSIAPQAAVGDCNGRLDLEGIMSGPGALEAVRATLSSLWQGLDTALGSGAQATPHDFAPLQVSQFWEGCS